MQRHAIRRPFGQALIHAKKQAAQRILPARSQRDIRIDGGRACHNVPDLFAIHQRQGIGENQAPNTVTRAFRSRRHDHAASRGAHQHRIAQIMVIEIFGNFLAMAFGINACAHLMAAFRAAIQRWRMHIMPGGAQPFGDKAPNPATLIGPVYQNNARHVAPPVLRRS